MSFSSNDFLQWLNEWTFKNRRDLILTHDIHKYPAMFIPEVVEKIINLYTEAGDTVLDIFSGSGTTLLESMILGRKSIGIELNPLAFLISKVKTTPIDISVMENGKQNLKG
ncbi:site-specific DNA-methyltransferase, partial [Acetobacter orleanensis]